VGGKGGSGGYREEMNQTLYAHMNKKKIKEYTSPFYENPKNWIRP
jgi:hypothetical protein